MNQPDRKAQADEIRALKAQLELERAERKNEILLLREDMEKLSRRQAILVKVLQILQSAEDMPKAMNEALAEIGNYIGVSRVKIFEKSADGASISNTIEWCNKGIESNLKKLQKLPLDFVPWFDLKDDKEGIYSIDDKTLAPEIAELMVRHGVKSILVFPMILDGVNCGFVDFNDCIVSRKWNENEVELLKNLSQIISATKRRYRIEQELLNERDRLRAIGDHFPNGSLFRFEINPQKMNEMSLSYMSATWEEVMGIDVEETKTDILKWYNTILPEFSTKMTEEIIKCTTSLQHFTLDYQIWHKKSGIRWIQASSHPKKISEEKIVFDGFVLDITARKNAEIELAKHHNELELLVKKRTEELETSYEELQASNEELFATHEEMKAINEELSEYQTNLEEMVEAKTSKIVAQQAHLEKLSNNQAIFINVLKIVQSADDLRQAMNQALAEIGKYAEVCRVHVFEISADRNFISNTLEWCNKGINPVMESLQNIPIEITRSWFDTFIAGNYIIASLDNETLNPEIARLMSNSEIKSLIVFPLSSGGINYGFATFNESRENRVWEENEVELLKSLSYIISSTKHRYQAETALHLSQRTMRTVLDNITAKVLVIDMETMEILFANKNIKAAMGIELKGLICWQVLQVGQTGVCDFCPKKRLLDSDGRPTGICQWEQYNELLKRFISYDAVAIEWTDGRLALMEIAVDITDRKMTELELIRAKEKAEESDKLKSAFLANMSHEIRTPVNGIVGFLPYIASNDLSSERKNKYQNIVRNSASQLVQLIDDIIDVAKIEAKQMKFFPVSVNINQLMREVQMFFETFLQTKNKEHIQLLLDEEEFIENCTLVIDPTRLRQVLTNLIGNAVKFTEKGYIRFGYRQSAPDKLEFVVEDTGIGMADNQHEIIFERFRQADINTSNIYGGTGLGLNIVKNIVRMMGGNIRVESVEGIGTTFYFTITYHPVNQEN